MQRARYEKQEDSEAMEMNTDKELFKLAIYGGAKVRTRPWPGRGLLGEDERAAVNALFDEAIATGNAFGYNGPEEEAYCREFASYMGGGYADAVNSGTTAVYTALRAVNPEPFTEVIVSPITDPGGMMPIVMCNCIPVIADTAPGSYNTGPEQVAELISPLTGAIIVAHIGGEPADMEGIMAVARKHGIPVIEDCAQAHGATLNGRKVGTFGDIAAFSTMFGKHHCTGGQGGMVYTRSEKLYQRSRWCSDRGKPFGLPAGSTNCVGALNLNLNDLSAAIGRVQLRKLPNIIKRRQYVAARIGEGIEQLKLVTAPDILSGAESSYWFMRLEFNSDSASCNKESYCKALQEEGIPIAVSYRHLPHTMEWFTKRQVFGSNGHPWTSPHYTGDADRAFTCPNAVAVTDKQFNLSVHEGWGEEEITDTLKAFNKVEEVLTK
ncbi:MAG: DegT/DnrJ/EryC1/StrS family aminotransferase [bacterium]|nr:DegT/DnrJ/EryC1/StrS family aminotransferase [bacterium]